MGVPRPCLPHAVNNNAPASTVSSAARKAPRGRASLCARTSSWASAGAAVRPLHSSLSIAAEDINVTAFRCPGSSGRRRATLATPARPTLQQSAADTPSADDEYCFAIPVARIVPDRRTERDLTNLPRSDPLFSTNYTACAPKDCAVASRLVSCKSVGLGS